MSAGLGGNQVGWNEPPHNPGTPNNRPGTTVKRGPQGQVAVGALTVGGTAIVAATAWTALPFAPNWSSFGPGEDPGLYQKGIDGKVYLQGLVKKSVALVGNDVIATLPPGFRPQTKQRRSPGSFAGYVMIVIDTAGQVYIEAGGSATWTNLGGIYFDPTI